MERNGGMRATKETKHEQTLHLEPELSEKKGERENRKALEQKRQGRER